MTHTIAVIHYVDGVGKTTTALNLGADLAAHGCRVLLVDLDPQADLSSRLGIEPGRSNLASVLAGGGTLQHLVCGWSDPSAASETIEMAIVPCDLQTMAGIDLQLGAVDQSERRLRHGLAEADPALDFILLDCPAVLSLLTINALHAADYVLIPVRAQGKAVEFAIPAPTR